MIVDDITTGFRSTYHFESGTYEGRLALPSFKTFRQLQIRNSPDVKEHIRYANLKELSLSTVYRTTRFSW